MKTIAGIITAAFILIGSNTYAQLSKVYISLDGTISFFSETPVENIDAVSQTLSCVLKPSTNEINYLVKITSFKFKKPLMQEHFNEKYLESDKYPLASFKGKINEEIDWSKDGVYPISATGNLKIHNVEKPYTEKGRLTIKDGKFTVEGSFNVKTADHDIEIPTLVMTNIAEVINVKHNCTLTPYVAKK